MKDMIRKYMPYGIVILLVYLLLPMLLTGGLADLFPIVYYVIFPATAIVSSVVYCAKNGLDFFFSLIAPVIFIPSMLIYNGGFFGKAVLTNIILLVSYLIASIFGLFLGDIVFGDKRRKQEKQDKAEAEKMMLEAKRQDELNRKAIEEDIAQEDRARVAKRRVHEPSNVNKQKHSSPKQQEHNNKYKSNANKKTVTAKDNQDDFDYDKYSSEMDRKKAETENEIDDILNEFGSNK